MIKKIKAFLRLFRSPKPEKPEFEGSPTYGGDNCWGKVSKSGQAVGKIGKDVQLPPRHFSVPTDEVIKLCDELGLHELAIKIMNDPPPIPFESDGCSSWVQEWNNVSLYPACFKHDLKYWAGRKGEEVERLVADAELAIDVAKLTGSTSMAVLMFNGVRAGGTDKFKLPFSWGYGRQ